MIDLWPWILAACALTIAAKVSGYLLPAEKLQHPAVLEIAGTVTIGLLAALIVLNTVATGTRLVLDARVAALAAAALALLLRAPFIVVVLAGAAAAALVRLAF